MICLCTQVHLRFDVSFSKINFFKKLFKGFFKKLYKYTSPKNCSHILLQKIVQVYFSKKLFMYTFKKLFIFIHTVEEDIWCLISDNWYLLKQYLFERKQNNILPFPLKVYWRSSNVTIWGSPKMPAIPGDWYATQSWDGRRSNLYCYKKNHVTSLIFQTIWVL